jgi:hypothetical protein
MLLKHPAAHRVKNAITTNDTPTLRNERSKLGDAAMGRVDCN